MSRFCKLSQTLWHCQYHIVWCPKYRFRVLEGEIKEEAEDCIRSFPSVQKCELLELNVQIDHVHVLVMIPPKISISNYVGTVKGRRLGCAYSWGKRACTTFASLRKFEVQMNHCVGQFDRCLSPSA